MYILSSHQIVPLLLCTVLFKLRAPMRAYVFGACDLSQPMKSRLIAEYSISLADY